MVTFTREILPWRFVLRCVPHENCVGRVKGNYNTRVNKSRSLACLFPSFLSPFKTDLP